MGIIDSLIIIPVLGNCDTKIRLLILCALNLNIYVQYFTSNSFIWSIIYGINTDCTSFDLYSALNCYRYGWNIEILSFIRNDLFFNFSCNKWLCFQFLWLIYTQNFHENCTQFFIWVYWFFFKFNVEFLLNFFLFSVFRNDLVLFRT